MALDLNIHKKRINEIENIINALLDIRLTLSLEKLSSPFIKKSKLQTIIEDKKQRAKDDLVSKEIDKVFEEYLSSEKTIPFNSTGKEIWENNSDLFKPGVEAKIDNTIKDLNNEKLSLEQMENYVGQGFEKGVSKVKRDNHFKSSIDDLNKAS